MEKNSVIFLAVPDSLRDEMPDSFKLDPSIPIPVECASGEESFNPIDLNMEMILSGMLRIIFTCGKNNTPVISASGLDRIPPEWVDYYRIFVLTVKPEIFHEFSSASIVKASNGDFDMALEINGILEGLFPGSPGVLLNKALVLEHKAVALEKNGRPAEKENAEALELYEAVLSLEPVFPDALFNAGFFFMNRKDFSRARDCFSRYVAAGEESEIPMEIPEDKRKQAQKIIQDIGGQGLDDPLYLEAYDCISRGNDEMGLSKIREFIERHPKIWNGWFVLGWALRKLGRYADSLAAFEKAVELEAREPGGANCDIRNEMAICMMELGDLAGARKKLEQALREEPENIKIISNLGVLAMKAGKKEEAAAFFRTVLELDPNDTLAKHFLSSN